MIDIVFNKKEFEYDAYTLIKAFYPQEEVSILYEGEEKTETFQEKEILTPEELEYNCYKICYRYLVNTGLMYRGVFNV